MRYVISFLGNMIWKLFGGVWLALVWFLLAMALAVTVIGFPLAVRCAKIGIVAWKPTSRRVGVNISSHLILNIIWFICVSWFILPFALVSIALQIASIVGIPLAVQWYKVLKVNLFPFGAVIK